MEKSLITKPITQRNVYFYGCGLWINAWTVCNKKLHFCEWWLLCGRVGYQYNLFLKSFIGEKKTSIEPVALAALNKLHLIPGFFKVVPEHVETRRLLSVENLSVTNGFLQMWCEIFPYDNLPMHHLMDISIKKPVKWLF